MQAASFQSHHQHRYIARCFCTGTDVSTGVGRTADLSGLGPKRFYKHVDVETHGDMHAVTVDGKLVKTPKRHVLATPLRALSVAVASEWDAQTGRIRPSSMPLTGLASAALDIAPEFRAKMSSSMQRYLHTDTTCIRPEAPRELVDAQNEAFAPIAGHAEARCGALHIERGGLAAAQSERAVAWVRDVVEGLDDWSLVAMDSATSCAKSVLVSIALRDGAVTPEEALKAARSEELWQSTVWGVVEGGHDLDDADATVRLLAAGSMFRFVEMDADHFQRCSHAQREAQ